jgi:hypothetical protein
VPQLGHLPWLAIKKQTNALALLPNWRTFHASLAQLTEMSLWFCDDTVIPTGTILTPLQLMLIANQRLGNQPGVFVVGQSH